MNIKVTEGKFQGKPIIQFWDEDWKWGNSEEPRPFLQFGLKKALIIMENLSSIKEFIEAYKEDN